MVTETVSCPHCQSLDLIRHGATDDGRQRYQCRDCGRRSRAAPRSNAYTEQEQATILRAYQERSSLRGLTRTFGVSRTTVAQWIKKSPVAPAAQGKPEAASRRTRARAGTG